jgi:predicted Zn finger-like uncharacterized protein
MILTCPQCATRYQADAAKFPSDGRNVRCAKCGTVWHQIGPAPEPDPETEIFVREPALAAIPSPPESEGIASQPRVAAFAPSAAATVDEPAPAPAHRAAATLGGIAVAGGWTLLIGLVLGIGWAAVNFRDNIATWLPQTSSFYAATGLPVNPRGIDFADVAQQIRTEDGQQVLAVTGRIVNRSNHELNVPLVRVGLFDMDRHELYHWTFVPGVSTLKPGASAKFRTRLSSPPAGTHDIEVRFAQEGE